MGEFAPDAVMPPGFEVTVNDVIVEPLEAGLAKLTVALASPAVALTAVGDPGTVAGADGTTMLEAAEAGPVPKALVAVTVKVYAVAFVRPVTVMGEPAPEAVMPSGLEVTV